MVDLIMGFTGKAGSGKSTIAHFLEEYLKEKKVSSQRISFAAPLKHAMAFLFDTDQRRFWDAHLKEQDIPGFDFTPRKVLQVIATEGMRTHLGKDIFIKLAMQRIERMSYSTTKIVIIDDVRFENEAAFIRERGVLIHIQKHRPWLVPSDNHVSELGISILDDELIFTNSYSSLDKLEDAVNKSARVIFSGYPNFFRQLTEAVPTSTSI